MVADGCFVYASLDLSQDCVSVGPYPQRGTRPTGKQNNKKKKTKSTKIPQTRIFWNNLFRLNLQVLPVQNYPSQGTTSSVLIRLPPTEERNSLVRLFIMLGTASLRLTCVFPDAREAVLQLTHLTDSPASAVGRTKGRKALQFFSVTLCPRDRELCAGRVNSGL